MKKILFTPFVFITLCLIACKNGKIQDTSITIEDSIAIEKKNDSIEREKLFELRGDTAFGTVCFGMDVKQTKSSTKLFIEKLKGPHDMGFLFGGIHFMDFLQFNEIEKVNIFALEGDNIDNRFYKNRLYSIRWHSYAERASDVDEIDAKINHLISLLEIKFGKCSERNNDLLMYFGKYINDKRVYVDGVIAKWETSKREIKIKITEDVFSNKQYYNDAFKYEYHIDVDFIDKDIENEASKFIEENIKLETEKELNQQKQDSIKMVNSL